MLLALYVSFGLPVCLPLLNMSESALTEQDLSLALQQQVSAKVILVVEGASLEPRLTISRMRGTRSPIKRVHDVQRCSNLLCVHTCQSAAIDWHSKPVCLQMMSTASSFNPTTRPIDTDQHLYSTCFPSAAPNCTFCTSLAQHSVSVLLRRVKRH